MNKRVTEDTLTLYYFNDGLTAAERSDVEAALGANAALAEEYRALCKELDDFADLPVPETPVNLAPRLHAALDEAAEQPRVSPVRDRPAFHFRSFVWGTAFAAALAVGIAIGFLIAPGTSPPVSPPVTATQTEDGSTSLSRGLLVHFRDSRDALSALDLSTNGERDQLIMNIVQQNRLFERMATQTDSQDLARVLRALEPILIKLASEDITPEEATRLQSQLAFELNVVLTKLSRQVSDNADAIDT
jgi:anti-sigma-K factor RskA